MSKYPLRSCTQPCFDLNGLQAFKYSLNFKSEPETQTFLICGTFKKGLQLVSVVAALAMPEKGSCGNWTARKGHGAQEQQGRTGIP